MLRLPETVNWCVDIACGCNWHRLCLRLCWVARGRSGFVIILRASGLGMGVGRVSRPQRRVGVIAIQDAELDTTRLVDAPPGAGVQGLLVPRVVDGGFIIRGCVVDGVEVPRWAICTTWELFSEDEGLEYWRWIVEATELPPWQESFLPAGMEMGVLAAGS